MIHYFNPGHETAVLMASEHYQPAAGILQIHNDLAYLPAWYASPDDYVLTENSVPDDFLAPAELLKPRAKPVIINDFIKNSDIFKNQEVSIWGISPQSIRYFEKLNSQYGLQLSVPRWKPEYYELTSRQVSQKILSRLIEDIPEIERDIIPRFYSSVKEIEDRISQSDEKMLIKSPYSSSGRGLIWLPPHKMAQSERQILSGMLKRQGHVSLEKVLYKRLDFSMHFENIADCRMQFIGYSVFTTTAKGAYEKSILASQKKLEAQITSFVDKSLLIRVKDNLTELLHEKYSPYYKGNIGIDMMIYRSNGRNKLHPCVEINMRKSMGYLAIQLFNNYIHPDFHGEFFVKYYSNPQTLLKEREDLQKQYPPVIEKNLIKNGYLNLCPITETTRYHAFILPALGSSAL